MFDLIKGIIEKEFKDWNLLIEEFGIGANDHGNEYYFTICFDSANINFYENIGYEGYKAVFTEKIQVILDLDEFEEGDYSCTLECMTYGNDTMIALITMCK